MRQLDFLGQLQVAMQAPYSHARDAVKDRDQAQDGRNENNPRG